MSEGDIKKENNFSEKSLFHADFSDESVFILPKDWEPVFIDYFGANPKNYTAVAERLRFIVQKYKDHSAFPDKFDGFDMEDEIESMTVYDNPRYYYEEDRGDWEDRWESEHKGEEHNEKKHTMAEIAKQILYLAMRAGVMQQAIEPKEKQLSGIKEMLRDIESGDTPSERTELLIEPLHFLKHLTPYINWPKE